MPSEHVLVGVDFAGPIAASDQRRKIVALAASRLDVGRYQVTGAGFNRRVLESTNPGWTAEELAGALIHGETVKVVAFDFPFSIPQALLDDPSFAMTVGQDGAFLTWRAFNAFVGDTLPLRTPIDLAPFVGWRTKANWRKRATDVVASAQPPLKDRYQVLFNMTLVGNALLAKLAESGRFSIVPFVNTDAAGDVIEVYPGQTMRLLGRRDYKRNPAGAIDAVIAYCAVRGISIEVDSQVRMFCQTYNSARPPASDPDGSDALIALATAILYHEGRAAEVIDAENRSLRLSEGAIWGPVAG